MFPLLALGDPVMVSLGQVIVTDFPDEMRLKRVGGGVVWSKPPAGG